MRTGGSTFQWQSDGLAGFRKADKPVDIQQYFPFCRDYPVVSPRMSLVPRLSCDVSLGKGFSLRG